MRSVGIMDSVQNILVLTCGDPAISEELSESLQMSFRPGVTPNGGRIAYADTTMAPALVASSIAWCQSLLVIDATCFGGQPGTLRCWFDEAMDLHLTSAEERNARQLSLLTLLEVARHGGPQPDRRVLIGVEPLPLSNMSAEKGVASGLGHRMQTAQVVAKAAEMARRILTAWLGASAHPVDPASGNVRPLGARMSFAREWTPPPISPPN